MRIKVQVIENGVARDVIYNTAEHMVCIHDLHPNELQNLAIAHFERKPMIFSPTHLVAKMNKDALRQFATEWPIQFFGGSHKAPSGVIFDPNGKPIDVKGG